MDGEVTYADLKFPPKADARRGARTKTAPAAGSSLWVCSTALLGILCLLLLATSIALGILLLTRMESSAELEVQKEEHAQSRNQGIEHNETESILNQTRAALRDAEERLQNWKALAGLHWYCPEGWTLANGTCYYTSSESKDWGSSLFDCFARGAHLAIIRRQTDQVFQNISEPAWVGAVYRYPNFIWYNTTGFMYLSNYPVSVSIGAYNCAAIGNAGELSARECMQNHAWMCERPAILLRLHVDAQLPDLSAHDVTYLSKAANGTN